MGKITQLVLESERLVLRPLVPEDSIVMTALLNDPDITLMMDAYPYPFPESEAQAVIDWSHRAALNGEGLGYAITLQVDGEFIGAIFLKLYTVVPEIGYWVGKGYWGKGYVTEAALRLIRYAFNELQLEKLSAYSLIQNTPSRRVLEKLQMKFIRTEEYPVPETDRVDVLAYYELEHSDWQPPA